MLRMSMRRSHALALIAACGIGAVALLLALLRDRDKPAAPVNNPAPAGAADEFAGTSGAARPASGKTTAGSQSESESSDSPSDRVAVLDSDPGLEGCLTVLEEIDDPDNPRTMSLRSQVKDFHGLVGKLATPDLTDEERRELYRLDEDWRNRIGEAQVHNMRTVMSMAIEAISQKRYTQFRPTDAVDPALDPVTQAMAANERLREILDRYDGPEDDRTYISCGGSEYGTSRIIEFYRSQHPQYFESFSRVSRLEEQRLSALEDRLRALGRLRRIDTDTSGR